MTGLQLPRDVGELSERLEDAARTLRRIPAARNSRPAEMGSGWPDYLREVMEAYGYQAARGGAVKASAAEIERMDEVLGWVSRWWSVAEMRRAGLPEDAGGLAWLRVGAGWQMRRLAEWRQQRWGMRRPPGGLNRESMRLLVVRALEHMLQGLTGQRVEPVEVEEDLPPVRIDVVVDRAVTARVAAIRADGTLVVQTRHARAEHREVPARRRRS